MFKPNPRFPAQLQKDREYQSGLAKSAEPARDAAKALAPVGTTVHTLKSGWVVEPGDYRDSIKVVVKKGKVYLSAFDFKAFWIEYGSIHNPVSAPLRRGVRAAGLKLDEASK